MVIRSNLGECFLLNLIIYYLLGILRRILINRKLSCLGFLVFLLNGWARFLLDIDADKANIVTAELSFHQLLNVISCLTKSSDFDEDEVSSLLSRADNLNAERNRVLHSLWEQLGSGVVVRAKATAKRKRGLDHVIEATTLNKLDDLSQQISQLTQDTMPVVFGDDR